MSDRLPNTYSAFPHNFPQGLPTQQPQHRSPQQPQLVGSQPGLVGIRTPEMWPQYRQQPQQHQQQQPQPPQPPLQQQQQQQQQQQHSGGELMHGGLNLQSQQFLQALRNRVLQGAMTPQQAQERFSMMQAAQSHTFQEQGVPQQMPPGFSGGPPGATPQQQHAALSQRPPASVNNQMLQRVIQSQDPSLARQFNMHPAQGQQPQQQQQQNGSGFNPRAGQNLNTPGMGLPQGQAPLQSSFVQPSPSVPPANVQSSSMPSTSQAPPPGQQVPAPSTNLADMPLPQLRTIYAQMIHTWMEGEKGFQASGSSGGDGDIQRRQQLRLKLDAYKQRILAVHEFINNKARASGDLSQLVNGPSWLGQAQRPTGLYPTPERPGQHNSPSLHQASVNQVSPQRSIPTPQPNFVPSITAQSNLTQMPSHVPTNGLPPNGPLVQMASAPPQQSTQIAQPLSQQPIQPHKIPLLPEDRFKGVFMQFTAATGLRLTDRDLVIEGRQVNLWALHRAVFMRNGFESVCTNDEWPLIGAVLGFPVFSGGDGGQPGPGRCAPAVAQRLQQLYNAVLRQFDQAYISSIVAKIRASSQMTSQAPQSQAQPHQPTEADYQALLASISSESPGITPEAMSILPRFSHTSGADLDSHRVPQHVIAFVEQNREQLQRAAQDQSGFRAGITSTKNAPLDHRAQVNEVSGLQTMARPPQAIAAHQQLQMQRQVPIQGQGKPNPLQSSQLFNPAGGPPMRPPTAQSTNAPNISMGAQNGGAQNHGGGMSVPMNPAGVNSIASGSVLPQSAGSMQIRRPTVEEIMAAKRWVDEQKKVAFSRGFDGVAGYPTITENDIPEYHRNLERLDQVLSNIEKYIHIAFAALRKEDFVTRMFTMMASARAQLEEFRKPNPRYVLELHSIRSMIQEADNMDKGLKTVLGMKLQGSPMPSAPQPPPQPTPAIATQFAPLVPPTVPPAPTAVPRQPHTAPAHRKNLSQSQPSRTTLPSPTPPPIASTSTPTPQATTPGISAPSPQTPKSPKSKSTSKPKQPPRRKVSTKTNSVETPAPAPAPAASTPTSSTSVDGKGGAKRVREDETDAPTPGVPSAPSPKRAKPDWEGPPNEEARKRDEDAENVKTNEQAMTLFENLTKFIDENPESAEAASNVLDAILRTCPSAPEMDDSTVAPSLNFDLQPMSPSHPVGPDIFDFIDYSAFDDTPTPDLVAGSSTNPSPESASDQDHPHTGRAGPSPQIPNAKTNDAYELLRAPVWREIAGGDAMFHQAQGWKWEGMLDAPDPAWAISS